MANANGNWPPSAWLLMAIGALASCGNAGEAFDRQRWLESELSAADNRLAMADGLIARNDLSGLSREEARGLLGPPDERRDFGDVCDDVYALGPERGVVSIDFEWLCLRYEDGRVTEAGLVRD